MTTIYLVIASAGDYDEFREWPVRAFREKKAADEAAATYELTAEQKKKDWEKANRAVHTAYGAACQEARIDRTFSQKQSALNRQLDADLAAIADFPEHGGENFHVDEIELI